MEKGILIETINKNNYNLDFEVDEVGMTWGVSYVRFVIGDKLKFESIEHFFFSTLKSKGNITSMLGGGKTWTERADLTRWANGLTIESIDDLTVIKFIDSSIREINEHATNWTEETTVNTSTLNLPKTFDQCWFLRETVDTRHYINTTQIYLAVSADKYLYIEGHWES
ncbi:MAG: hypothetical protein ACK5RG_21815 [Cyclobacteriaceae bacterium]|jgi:hypothetical protein|nr:hypothetical protein [Flammeovirgaceae bacterium]